MENRSIRLAAAPQTPREAYSGTASRYGLASPRSSYPVHPGGYYAGGSSGSTYGGYVQPFEAALLSNPCDALEACCKKPQPHQVADFSAALGPRWNYVGEGMGGYDKMLSVNYVGDGRGSYAFDYPEPSSGKGYLCLSVLLSFAVVLGTSFMVRQCDVSNDDWPWCHNPLEEYLENLGRSSGVLKQAEPPTEEYCADLGDSSGQKKMDACCKASRPLCRVFMTAQLSAEASDGHGKKHGSSGYGISGVHRRPSRGATTPAPKLLHDCTRDYEEWDTLWSKEKKDWCCHHAMRGCSDGPPHAEGLTDKDDTFSCDKEAEAEWSVPKKAWCCMNENKACPEG